MELNSCIFTSFVTRLISPLYHFTSCRTLNIQNNTCLSLLFLKDIQWCTAVCVYSLVCLSICPYTSSNSLLYDHKNCGGIMVQCFYPHCLQTYSFDFHLINWSLGKILLQVWYNVNNRKYGSAFWGNSQKSARNKHFIKVYYTIKWKDKSREQWS